MNTIAQNIKLRLSLRDPLQDSLDIVAQLAERLSLEKDADLAKELLTVKGLFPTCTNFERDFPSLTFSIATGVGKTRLMGACIAYLYLAKGIKNFFILAPGSTIYEKLIEDFGNPSYHKYVFKGISEFVHKQPMIITGDNYSQQSNLFSESEIRINVFNIQKFNRDTREASRGKEKGKPSKIKRLSEYLGQSYWNYLMSLDDLVILMDEAHRYHGGSSKKALNELKPVLGLEMTATPIGQNGKQFKNVVYEYSLAQALADGKYVKNPAIATRKDFKPRGLSEKEIEIVKLEDAISIHEKTKKDLEIYAANNNVKLVKPFILVVCKDTTHAGEVFKLINEDTFFDGQYKDKVLQIDSTTKKQEDVERQFLNLEHPDNEIEIVIHVNMLKEGWDVTNLYTIVPLRAANAGVLIEQTIGRGLRLPYDGKRTGDENVDKLTVVAHENFEAVIKAAQDPNSVLNKMNFIEITDDELRTKTKVIKGKPNIQLQFDAEQKKIAKIKEPKKKQAAQNTLDAKKLLIDIFNDEEVIRKTKGLNLTIENTESIIIEAASKKLDIGQQNLFKEEIKKNVKALIKPVLTNHLSLIIKIPRMDLVQGEVTASFMPFELDTTDISYTALNQEIIRMNLRDGLNVETIQVKTSGSYGNPIKLIIAEVINYPEVDYDDNADLLYQLATQAFNSLKADIPDTKELNLTVYQFKAAIAEKIYQQMKAHFKVSVPDYETPNVLPFVKIEPWSFTALINKGYRDYRDIIQPTSDIKKYVYRGFEKACHFEYKFDSKAEQDLAFVLESDKQVEKWLRPALNQFRIWWNNNSKQYKPDFIVETADTIYMIEPKQSNRMEDQEVLEKKIAALKYCKHASNYTKEHGGKEWKYVLIPHTEISRTSSLDYLVANYCC